MPKTMRFFLGRRLLLGTVLGTVLGSFLGSFWVLGRFWAIQSDAGSKNPLQMHVMCVGCIRMT